MKPYLALIFTCLVILTAGQASAENNASLGLYLATSRDDVIIAHVYPNGPSFPHREREEILAYDKIICVGDHSEFNCTDDVTDAVSAAVEHSGGPVAFVVERDGVLYPALIWAAMTFTAPDGNEEYNPITPSDEWRRYGAELRAVTLLGLPTVAYEWNREVLRRRAQNLQVTAAVWDLMDREALPEELQEAHAAVIDAMLEWASVFESPGNNEQAFKRRADEKFAALATAATHHQETVNRLYLEANP